jgi:hypothetical protein
MLSIQSLMSSNPYENEPGYENYRAGSEDELKTAYREKVSGNVLGEDWECNLMQPDSSRNTQNNRDPKT